MEWASFARVFPVQGAITKASKSFFGPMGSTCSIVLRGAVQQISPAQRICSRVLPKRLSMVLAEKEKMGVTV